jgi:peptidoglycan hydrolase CwlO-like protein
MQTQVGLTDTKPFYSETQESNQSIDKTQAEIKDLEGTVECLKKELANEKQSLKMSSD